MTMARRQTLIQLDDARLAALDERAAASGRSRSELIREAIDLLLGTGDAAAIDAAIVGGYERSPASERDPWAFESALAAIRAEPW
jgi:metal-responsive CopG/Arc/MetJ family transcriptional regulator